MITWYLNSAVTNSTGSGTSWANAATTMALLLANGIAGGDDVNVVNTHNENSAVSTTWTFPGTSSAPNRIFSCNQGNSPAQASNLVAGAKFGLNGSFTWLIDGFFYAYGIKISSGTSGTPSITLGNGAQIWENCNFVLNGVGSSKLFVGGNTSGNIKFINTNVYTVSPSPIQPTYPFYWLGGTMNTGVSGAYSNIFTPVASSPLNLVIENVDFSPLNSASITNFVGTNANVVGAMQFINCALPTSTTLVALPTSDFEVYVVNSDTGTKSYRHEKYNAFGQQTLATTVYNNATDGSNAISWALNALTAATATRAMPFESIKIVQWALPGTYGNCVVQATSSTSGLTNSDFWVEAEYMSNATNPLTSIVSSAPTTQLTANVAIGNTGTWSTGSQGFNYKISIPSFTTTLPGYIRFTIKLSKNITIYVDPAVVVSA